MNIIESSQEPGFPAYQEHIVVSNQRTKYVLPICNIVWLEAKRVYTIIHMKSGKQHICSHNLKIVFAELDPELFFRVHKSYAVNLQEVKVYREGRGGKVVMNDGTTIDIAQRNKTAFLKRFLSGRSVIRVR